MIKVFKNIWENMFPPVGPKYKVHTPLRYKSHMDAIKNGLNPGDAYEYVDIDDDGPDRGVIWHSEIPYHPIKRRGDGSYPYSEDELKAIEVYYTIVAGSVKPKVSSMYGTSYSTPTAIGRLAGNCNAGPNQHAIAHQSGALTGTGHRIIGGALTKIKI
jgi:hypothetical protein